MPEEPDRGPPESTAACPRVWPIIAFTFAYVGVATPVSIARGNTEFLIYIAVLLLFFGIIYAIRNRAGLSCGALWCLSIWGLAHMLGGLVPVPEHWPYDGKMAVLYSLWIIPETLKYDHVVHTFGFGVTAWVCWQGLRQAWPGPRESVRPTLGLLVLSWAGGLGFGAVNELVEFIATLLLAETNVGGYRNTGWDLVSNTVGATIAMFLVRVTWKPPPAP